MKKIALVLAVVMLLAVGMSSVASAESIFQQMADSISTWSWSGGGS